MAKLFLGKRGQHFLEYTMLILIISAAIIAIRQYMLRSLNWQFKQIQEEISEPTRGD